MEYYKTFLNSVEGLKKVSEQDTSRLFVLFRNTDDDSEGRIFVCSSMDSLCSYSTNSKEGPALAYYPDIQYEPGQSHVLFIADEGYTIHTMVFNTAILANEYFNRISKLRLEVNWN